MLSVFLPCIVLPWEGFTSMGNEKIPPILYLGPFTALFTVISLWVRACVTFATLSIFNV